MLGGPLTVPTGASLWPGSPWGWGREGGEGTGVTREDQPPRIPLPPSGSPGGRRRGAGFVGLRAQLLLQGRRLRPKVQEEDVGRVGKGGAAVLREAGKGGAGSGPLALGRGGPAGPALGGLGSPEARRSRRQCASPRSGGCVPQGRGSSCGPPPGKFHTWVKTERGEGRAPAPCSQLQWASPCLISIHSHLWIILVQIPDIGRFYPEPWPGT